MKKFKTILAAVLTAALTLSFSAVVMANDNPDAGATEPAASVDTSTWTSDATTLTLKKDYSGDVFPTETLSFTVTPDEGNPDATPVVTIADITTSAAAENEITVSIPSYSKVGVYKYTIAETAGTSQGTTYDTNTIGFSVLVSYDYANSKLKTEVALTTAASAEASGEGEAEAAKQDTFTNTYDEGTLTVNKTVAGNLADQSKLFTIKVTLTAEDGKTVNTDITVAGGSDAGNAQTVAKGWTGSKDITIQLKHDETVTFSHIPAGVSYTVVEDAKHLAAGSTPTAAELNGEEGYLATYTSATGTIEKDTTAAAAIVNTKETQVDTGITLDSMPYILLLVMVIAAAAFVLIRRRSLED